ncbi:MAG: ABC transporter substrate-binding protein, partial [Planctomycetota bacterium]
MFSETLRFQRLLRFTALLLFPLLAGGMTGCTSQPASSGPQEIQSVAAPSPENIFRIPLMTNPPDLDPILVSDTTSSGVATKLFTSLYDYTPELELEPCLAKEMPAISEDGRVYDIQLRDDVRFTNGRTVTAADMKYSIQRLASVRSKRTNLVEKILGAKEAIAGASKSQEVSPEIPGIEVMGDHSLRITLIESSPPFINKLAMVNTAAVPREVIEEIGDKFSRNPVGSGPFTLTEWKEGVSLKLTANQDYFEGAPKLAGIHYRVIPEPLAQLEEY